MKLSYFWNDYGPTVLTGIIAIVAIAIFLLCYGSIINIENKMDSFKRNCTTSSGHIYQPDQYAWCLRKDGTVLEVYP